MASLAKKKTEEELPRFGKPSNNLKMGIVGLPNVGKSSLFNLLGEASDIPAENYPFCTIDPNKARCPVPDKRYKYLCDLWNPPSKYPAYLHLVDIAGLIKGASEGAGLGNAFLSHIQAVDGLLHVVRAFDNDDVVHVDDSVDPTRDLETITHELCAKDIQYVTKQRALREADVKKNPTMKLPAMFFTVMDKAMELLTSNQPLGKAVWTASEIDKINELIPGCLTTKPMIYLVNISAKDMKRGGNKHYIKIKEWVVEHGGGIVIPFSIELEEEMKQMKANGQEPKGKSVLPRIIKCGYRQLNLCYFFTTGVKEVRCWTFRKGVTAPVAASVIHNDFERGFIKADVVSYDDYVKYSEGEKGMAKVKASGKFRQEGKNYVVQDGDIIHFKCNVTNKGKKK